jgi:hypothetical protein
VDSPSLAVPQDCWVGGLSDEASRFPGGGVESVPSPIVMKVKG